MPGRFVASKRTPPSLPPEFGLASERLRRWASSVAIDEVLPHLTDIEQKEVAALLILLQSGPWKKQARELYTQADALHRAAVDSLSAHDAGADPREIHQAWMRAQGYANGLAAHIDDLAIDYTRVRRRPVKPAPMRKCRQLRAGPTAKSRRKVPGTRKVAFNTTTGEIRYTVGSQVHVFKVHVIRGFDVAAHLSAHRQKRWSHQELIKAVWPSNTVINPDGVAVHLTNLRNLLGQWGQAGADLAKRIKSRRKHCWIDLSPRGDEN